MTELLSAEFLKTVFWKISNSQDAISYNPVDDAKQRRNGQISEFTMAANT
jgi:hypothetical protein